MLRPMRMDPALGVFVRLHTWLPGEGALKTEQKRGHGKITEKHVYFAYMQLSQFCATGAHSAVGTDWMGSDLNARAMLFPSFSSGSFDAAVRTLLLAMTSVGFAACDIRYY